MKPKAPYEAQEQIALLKWIHLQPKIRDYVISIPNEGMRSKRLGQKMVLMGLSKGASDIFIAYPANGYHGMWMELKRVSDSRVTASQVGFLDRMNKIGYATALCFGWIEGKEAIESYLAG